MNNSPWSAYGRGQNNTEASAAAQTPDPAFGAARELMVTQERLRQYLTRTLQEYNEIRAGRAGYTRIIAEALKPPPRPETIEETLRRLCREQARGRRSRGNRSRNV